MKERLFFQTRGLILVFRFYSAVILLSRALKNALRRLFHLMLCHPALFQVVLICSGPAARHHEVCCIVILHSSSGYGVLMGTITTSLLRRMGLITYNSTEL